MMLSPEKLLSLNPLTALKTMISEEWINSEPDWFVIKELRGNNNSPDYIVRVGLSNLHVPLSKRAIYKEYFEYTLTKLDIGILNNRGPLPIKLSTIKTKPTLIEALEYLFKSRGNLEFDRTDFTDPDVELVPGEMSVDTSIGSYRWHGSLALLVSVVKEEIDKYLARRDCIMDHTLYFNASTLKSEIVSSLNRQNVGLLQVLLSDNWCSILPNTMEVIGNESDQLNTKITLVFDGQTSPYSGEVDVTYGRKSFYTTFGYPIGIPANIYGKAETLAYLNNKLGVSLSNSDITLPATRLVGKHPFDINPSSLTYVGTLWVNYE